MVLTKSEMREWRSISAKAKRHRIGVRRVGPANVKFQSGVYAQLGTGRATGIINAKIAIKKKRRSKK